MKYWLLCTLLLLPAFVHAASVKLTWDASAPCTPVSCAPDTYNVYRSVEGGVTSRIGTVLAPSQAFSDTSPAKGNNCYTVRAANIAGESPDSNTVCLLLPEVPKAPLNEKGILTP